MDKDNNKINKCKKSKQIELNNQNIRYTFCIILLVKYF